MWGVGPVTKAQARRERRARPSASWRRRPGGRWSGCSGRRRARSSPRSPGTATRARSAPSRRAHSAGAQSALGRKPAEERVFPPTLRHLADRVASAAEGQVAAGPHGDGARALRRHARGDALDHARPADLGDRDAGRDRRGAGAAASRRPPGGADDLAAGDLGVASRRAPRVCSSTCRWGSPTRRAGPAARRGLARFGGRPRRRQDPRPFRLGGGRLCLGRRWASGDRSRTRSASWPRRSCDVLYSTALGQEKECRHGPQHTQTGQSGARSLGRSASAAWA